MSDIAFKYYKIPEPLDNVCDIATEMIFTADISKILKDTYGDRYLDEIDPKYIVDLLKKMTMGNCKIVIHGKNILDEDKFKKAVGKKVKTEVWFKTKYGLVKKNEQHIQKLIE